MKVLITGGCGMIGYHAAMYYCANGHEVQVMDNLERSSLLGHEVSNKRKYFNRDLLVKEGVRWVDGDVSEREHWKMFEDFSPDAIIHMAAQCGVPTSIADPRRDYEVNLQGTFNMLEFARANNSKVIFASTNKVYPIHDSFIKKDDLWHFTKPEWDTYGFPVVSNLIGSRTPYGWSKYAGDLLCQEYHHTYGLEVGIFRMSCIYGTNQFGFEEQGWATWFAIATELERPITIYGDGCQVRDMLYVEDCIKAYNTFILSNKSFGCYNLGGGIHNTLSLNTCQDILEQVTGKRSPVTYEDWRPSDQKTYVTDIRPIQNELRWRPEVFPESGLRNIVEWVSKNRDVF